MLVDFNGRDAESLHTRGIQCHANLTIDATVLNLRHAVDRQQSFTNGVVNEPTQLLRCHAGRADRKIGKWPTIDILPDDLGFFDTVRQVTANF